ncbi:cathepsin-L-like cysteine peptidase [Biomphalaria pfeifferi]|uniref:Cathepsin-L-like cysteine peptidase n=1 Tax=Biomphalaria pfeifferi TaxID=112525 RepID=A0AAD8CAK7_BIOPF|nr:cathepsin-L-like cysteine peptidase [Biomphalaria pfeifferi]
MFKLTLFALALAVASASTTANWLIFKSKHNKTYSGDEDVIRRYIWESNLKVIVEHNERYAQGLETYYLGENKYADMTHEEFVRTMNGLRVNRPLNPGNFVSGLLKNALPDSVDWRKEGYVTDIKDQGQCGSCWAFSTTGSLEGQHFKASKSLVSLSESNLVDCSQKFGNQGCNGGLMDQAFQYVIKNKGLDTEQSYPYKPEDRKCAFKTANVGATENSFKDVTSGSEDALQEAVATIGPISVAIDASHNSFQLYKGGIYNERQCSSTQLDHGVLAVGYGAEGNKDFWIVKNSWGKSWGEEGYIRMTRNKKNQCGIATMASYPIV